MNKKTMLYKPSLSVTYIFIFINIYHLLSLHQLNSFTIITKAEPKNKFLTLFISYSKELELPLFSGKIILHTFEGLFFTTML